MNLKRNIKYVPWNVETPVDSEKIETGSVLITGGTGGLGNIIVRFFVKNYPSLNLVIVSRSADESMSTSQATYIQCDVTNKININNVIKTRNDWIGVIHATGIVSPKHLLFHESSNEDWIHHYNIKKLATDNLWNLFSNYELRFFILTSSISACFW